MGNEMNKEDLIAQLKAGLADGTVTAADIEAAVGTLPAPIVAEQMAPAPTRKTGRPDKLSAVDVLFYIAGIVLFSAIMSVIVQSWGDGSALTHILLSVGLGAALWGGVVPLMRSKEQNDMRRGLVNALLLTGSLLIIVGGYIITNEIVGGFSSLNLIPGALTLLMVGAVHLAFDKVVKRDLTLLMGILLAVAAFPTFVFGLLENITITIDMGAVIILFSALLLAFATRVVARINPGRGDHRRAFDGLAAFVGLGAIYSATYSDYGLLWFTMLVAGVLGIFYLSIAAQDKHLLGNASFFMVLAVITISFRYFSGYGVTTSLVMATLGLIGSAVVAATINKHYFGQQAPQAPTPAAPAAPATPPVVVDTPPTAEDTAPPKEDDTPSI